MPKPLRLAGWTIFASLSLLSCFPPPKSHDAKLVVAVVGDGLSAERQITTRERLWPANRAQGTAMWKGAVTAYEASPRLNSVRRIFTLEPFNDVGNEREAALIAEEILRNPKYVAVIGHAASSTTYEGALRYSKGNIPLLMPIATSPSAVFSPGQPLEIANRIPFTFRLPPADIPFQAAAVATLVAEEIPQTLLPTNSPRVALLRDVSVGASLYSKPLSEATEDFLDHLIVYRDDLDVQDANSYSGIADALRHESVDVLVFVGYASTVIKLLGQIRDAYLAVAQPPPFIVLTDGCKAPDLDAHIHGLSVFLTFPIADLAHLENEGCAGPDLEVLKRALSDEPTQSYEVYGYDAVLLVGAAIERCRTTQISRLCLADNLANLGPAGFPGICTPYSFKEGDNDLSKYYLYTNLHGDKAATRMRVWKELSAERLRNFALRR